MGIRVDRLCYFASNADGDAYIVAIGLVAAGVLGMTATLVPQLDATNGSLVVTSTEDPNVDDEGLCKANSGVTVNKTITNMVGVA